MKAEDKNIQEHSRESVDNSVLREPLAPSRGKRPAGQKGVAFLRLLTILLILLAIAARRDMQVVGYSLEQKEVVADTMTVAADTMVIHTALLADDVFGYAGTTPFDIYILNDTVVKVVPLENTETPEFFAEAVGIANSWNGKKVSEAYTMPVDAVSGATLSSNAIIENARRGLAYASKHSGQGTQIDLSVKFVVTLLVLLTGMILPIFFRAKKMRTAILVQDVVVLGLWSGTFISYSMLVGIASNGLPLTSIASLVPILLLIVAFIYPLFGKKAHYCTHICPFGAAQELANRIPCKNVKLGAKTIRTLTEMRRILWWILTLLMLLGVCFEWMDYELFIAFIFSSAKNIIIVFAIITLILSVFTPRPYCRFVCPTGYLLKLSFPHKRK